MVIVMRNFPEFIWSMWATQLLGAVGVFLNAWSPPTVLQFCIINTSPKAIIIDTERAPLIAGEILSNIRSKIELNAVLVARAHEGPIHNKLPEHMQSMERAVAAHDGPKDIWKSLNEPDYDDNATIFFTSGTTGMPKGVLSTQRSFLQNTWNCLMARPKALLRDGASIESITTPNPDQPRHSVLLGTPLFHVSACTTTQMVATKPGAKIVLMRKWDRELGKLMFLFCFSPILC